VPSGPAGQKPYVLLREVMKEKKRYAVGSIVLSGHDELVLIRPTGDLLTMSVLYHEDQLKRSSGFSDEIKDSKITEQELHLAGILVEESSPKKFDFSDFTDEYTERVAQAIEAKLGGKKPERAPHAKAPHVINLMDALRKSVDMAQSEEKPARSRRRRGHAKKKSA